MIQKNMFRLILDDFIFFYKNPPKNIPRKFIKKFTLNGKIKIECWYFDESQKGEIRFYDSKAINDFITKIKNKESNHYGKTDQYLYDSLKKYTIFNLNVAVIGSTCPWYEAICINYGGSPYTIDYQKIISNDNRLKISTVSEFEKDPILFDCAFSISSYEHYGLGRYGDPIDPFGDLKAMRNLKNMIKKNGILYLSVPIGKDCLVWNAHRIYGKIRFPLLIKGWELIDSFGFEEKQLEDYSIRGLNSIQPVFILKNI